MSAEWSRCSHRRRAASGEAWVELDPSSELLLTSTSRLSALVPRRMRGERCSWNRDKRDRDRLGWAMLPLGVHIEGGVGVVKGCVCVTWTALTDTARERR